MVMEMVLNQVVLVRRIWDRTSIDSVYLPSAFASYVVIEFFSASFGFSQVNQEITSFVFS
jgi:hypothetical protein